MKIAITGGAGFIGTRLAELLLAQGHDLVLCDIKTSDRFPEMSRAVDVQDQAAMEEAFKGVDIIYHLAAEHRDDVRPVQKYYDVNVAGAEKLVKAAEKNGIRKIIFTSTVAVYGLDAGDSRETDTPDPFNDYGKSKLQSEKIFEDWAAAAPDRSLLNMRLVATFGPGNRGNIYTLMNQIASGKFVMIGPGDNKKSIAYVGNVAAFLAHGLNTPPGVHVCNYADKPDLTMKEMVSDIRKAMGLDGPGIKLPYTLGIAGGSVFDIAAKITGKTFPISVIRVKKFCANTVVNADKAHHASGFKAPYTLQDGLNEMIAAEFKPQEKAAA